MSYINDTTIVIRSVGERTEELCKDLIVQQGMPNSSIFIVRESPFSKALESSFKIGIKDGRRWTFCVDADLLLRSGSIQRMIEVFEHQPSNVCEIQGFILDKFFGGPRVGGVHVYKTSLLQEVMKSIPSEGEDIRPEARTLKKMNEKGFPYVITPYIVGLHDFEQDYPDILRKTFIYSKKHIIYAHLFGSFWTKKSINDQDYIYAMNGFSMGFKSMDKVFIDHSKNNFLDSSIPKKNPLKKSDWGIERIDKIISQWKDDEIFTEVFPISFIGVRGATKIKTYKYQTGVLYRRLGIVKMFLYVIGLGLKKVSFSIKKAVL